MINIFSHFFKKNSKYHLKAVHDMDLERYLKSIGIYDKIFLGEIKCKFCGSTISLKTLEAIFPTEGHINVVCHNKRCLDQI
jgi:hypothetical protein